MKRSIVVSIFFMMIFAACEEQVYLYEPVLFTGKYTMSTMHMEYEGQSMDDLMPMPGEMAAAGFTLNVDRTYELPTEFRKYFYFLNSAAISNGSIIGTWSTYDKLDRGAENDLVLVFEPEDNLTIVSGDMTESMTLSMESINTSEDVGMFSMMGSLNGTYDTKETIPNAQGFDAGVEYGKKYGFWLAYKSAFDNYMKQNPDAPIDNMHTYANNYLRLIDLSTNVDSQFNEGLQLGLEQGSVDGSAMARDYMMMEEKNYNYSFQFKKQ